MGPPGKSEERPNGSSSRHVSIEDFIWTRDSVVNGLARLESSIQELSRAYIVHTNTVMAKGSGSPLELFNLTVPVMNQNTLFGAHFGTPRPAQVQEPPERKRKKRAHDKNAPKRPVTPYFLYMQTARSQISSELKDATGKENSAKQITDEGTKRWNAMTPADREHWSYQYQVNFARYKLKVKAYKAGEPIPEISDTEAKKMFDDEHNNGLITEQLLSHVELEQTEDHLESESSISTSSEEPPVSPKAPSPPRTSKRRKNDKDQHVRQPSPAPQLPMEGPDLDSDESMSLVLETEKRNKRLIRKKDFAEVDESLGSGDLVPAITFPSKRNSDNSPKLKRSKRKRKSDN